ncbi:unnamed protein product [Effrenium voratum]|nr:unnamed protein product [Effrenium voratum]
MAVDAMPVLPSVCAIRACPGNVEKKGVVLHCDAATHHRGHLVREASGSLSWKFCSRGASELTKKGLTVLTAEPDSAAPQEPPAPALVDPPAPVTPEPEAAEGTVDTVSEETPPKHVELGFGDRKVKGRMNFGGGGLKRLTMCAVCKVSRDDTFHGNLCRICEREMRRRGSRSYLKLSQPELAQIAEASSATRADKALKDAGDIVEQLSKDKRLADLVAAEVAKRLRREQASI